MKKILLQKMNGMNVYRIEMNRANGITPKPGDDSRNKFFVVLGFDAEGNAYLSHNSFVDCSKLKSVSLEKFEKWEFKGRMDDEDVQLILQLSRVVRMKIPNIWLCMACRNIARSGYKRSSYF